VVSSSPFRDFDFSVHSLHRSQISQDLYNYLSLLIWFATLFMQHASVIVLELVLVLVLVLDL
jgi:hypothetical protein